MQSYQAELKHQECHSWQELWGLSRPTLSKISITFLLLFYCCYNKVPQTWCFIPIQIYFLKVLKARGPKAVSLVEIKVLSGWCILWRPQGRNLVLVSSDFWDLSLSLARGCIILISLIMWASSLLPVSSLPLFPPYVRIPVIAMKAHLELSRIRSPGQDN